MYSLGIERDFILCKLQKKHSFSVSKVLNLKGFRTFEKRLQLKYKNLGKTLNFVKNIRILEIYIQRSDGFRFQKSGSGFTLSGIFG